MEVKRVVHGWDWRHEGAPAGGWIRACGGGGEGGGDGVSGGRGGGAYDGGWVRKVGLAMGCGCLGGGKSGLALSIRIVLCESDTRAL